MVTLLNKMVAGLTIRLGATTANRVEKPSLLFVKAFANADSAAEPLGPTIKSICAISLPSPTKDSPTHNLVIFAMLNVPLEEKNENSS
jgi:hypothetical protein